MDNTFFRFETWGESHPGKVRELNEDRFLSKPENGVWLVADGMGGHEAGELASAAIIEHVESIGQASSPPDLRARLIDRLMRANTQIQEMSAERGGAVMGSTVVALLVYEKHYACVWSGDSRLYRVRNEAIEQISRDHTEVQLLLDRGMITPEQAENSPRKNVITQAVGVFEELSTETSHGELCEGDSYILCSDGLTEHVTDDEILDTVFGRKPQNACERLMEMTLERGATDNVTVVVVQFQNIDATVPIGANVFDE